ncbi:MAG TPA: hypothetical protein VGS09_11510, partial [Actinomycetota bacterium]|nr:hypothetical protein [Actinomycetota bacterium]
MTRLLRGHPDVSSLILRHAGNAPTPGRDDAGKGRIGHEPLGRSIEPKDAFIHCEYGTAVDLVNGDLA